MAKTKKAGKSKKITPLMQQYFGLKAKYPDALLLYRVGDFYETFGEDAVKASATLGITLTARNNGGSDIELAGFPYHSLDTYMPRLVRAGYRVALCEQMEKPKPGVKIVRRAVTEVITPGVTTNDALLDYKQNNFFATIVFGQHDRFALAFLDISTGEFFVHEGDHASTDKLLQSFQPSEVIMPKSRQKEFIALFGEGLLRYSLEDWIFTFDFGREKLLNHFKVPSLKGFGVEEFELAQCAAGAALHYLSTTENTKLGHIVSVSRLQNEQYVWLDRFTIRNLELIFAAHDTGAALASVMDKTTSPMGARLLKKWVMLPLTNLTKIKERQDIVAFFTKNQEVYKEIIPFLKQMGDLERLMSKATVGKINPREIVQLKRALIAIEALKELLAGLNHAALKKVAEGLNPCESLKVTIEAKIMPDPPVNLNKGSVIADGASEPLDELRSIIKNGRDVLAELQDREARATGITNLKIGFNNVFGYYLEVTNKHKELAPETWIRKQTLANAERYITPELKVLEEKILGAEEKILALEAQIYAELIEELTTYTAYIQNNAQLCARIDCLISFTVLSERWGYCRPDLDDSTVIDIKQGRHPVIEQSLNEGDTYIPNDVYLDNDSCQVMMITGPNMSGKSALLRQTALISLMAQMGSFVPAASARLGLVDKVFTRVGASDNISSGESTFMVEMNETALIMNNISERSLILLDEIGRGTSTYDGISIAWSIAEYLHNNDRARPKTLFATHYHELNALTNTMERVQNFHVSTREVGQKVVFLRKLEPGGSEHSFGIHVAKLAGMPSAIVDRANDILKHLEDKHIGDAELADTSVSKNKSKVEVKDARKQVQSIPQQMQLSIFEVDTYTRQIKEELLKLDPNTMTPIDALWKLNELRKIAEKEK